MAVERVREYRMSEFKHTIIPVREEELTEDGIVGALLRFCGSKPQHLQIGLGKIVSKKLSFPAKHHAPKVHSVHLVFVENAGQIAQAVLDTCSLLNIDASQTGIVLDVRHVGGGKLDKVTRELSEKTGGAHICVM